jgi:Tfp pilus assembly protein PilP
MKLTKKTTLLLISITVLLVILSTLSLSMFQIHFLHGAHAQSLAENAPNQKVETSVPAKSPQQDPEGPQVGVLMDLDVQESYLYDPTNKPDPFYPFWLSPKKSGGSLAAKDLVLIDPLQQFELDQLKVVGVFWGIQKPKAVIRDPTGKNHYVYLDTKLGKNNGYVIAIRESEVIVVEATRDEDKVTKHTKILSVKH